MTESELFDLMREIDPETKRVPIGIMRLAVKLEERIRSQMEAELSETKRLLELCMTCRTNIVSQNIHY